MNIMNAEQILSAMNEIRDDYITAYAEKPSAAKVKQHRHFRAWSICAACIALFIIVTPAVLHRLHPAGMDDPKCVARYEFASYAELCSVLPERSIIANIPDSQSAEIRAFAECPEGTKDFTDYSNYSYLNLDISYGAAGLNIWCVVHSERTAKEEVDRTPLAYPPERLTVATVSGCDIYSTSYEDHADTITRAVFSKDGSLYQFITASLSQEELIQYIRDMLGVDENW